MLPMLTVSGVPGLLYLNGRFCGETGAASMPLSPDGVQYLELRPFDAAAKGAVLRLRVQGGRLVEGVSGDVYAVQWPSGWIAMELKEESGAAREMAQPPRLLSSIQMPGGQYLLVDEGGVASFGRDANEAIFLPVDDILDGALRALPYPGLCVAEGRTRSGQYAAILRANDKPEIIQFAAGSVAQIDALGMLTSIEPLGDLVGHAAVRTFTPSPQGDYTETNRDMTWRDGAPNWPASAEDTARAWLEAVQIGAREEAAGYLLSPARQAAYEQAVGPFSAVTALPTVGASGIRLGVLQMTAENLAAVREIVFSVAQGLSEQGAFKIENISEGICD